VRFRFDQCLLDDELRELKRADAPVALQPQVFDLLLYLIQERERVVSKDDLISRIWQDRAVSDSALNSRINAARQAIGDDGQRQHLIRTVARKGFRFVGEVSEEASGAQSREQRSTPGQRTPDRPAIAVLAFENMSDDPEQDYFCDGISEDILTALSKVRWFLVISRNSSFAYKGRAVQLKQIGDELGVRYVVEGSVRKSGDRLRITAQLNDTTTGAHLWAEQYDRELGDIFAVQDEITNAIVVAIEPQIYTAENFRAKRKAPDNMDAWGLLMRALSHFWRMTHQDHVAVVANRRHHDVGVIRQSQARIVLANIDRNGLVPQSFQFRNQPVPIPGHSSGARNKYESAHVPSCSVVWR